MEDLYTENYERVPKKLIRSTNKIDHTEGLEGWIILKCLLLLTFKVFILSIFNTFIIDTYMDLALHVHLRYNKVGEKGERTICYFIISYVFFACKLEIMHQKWEKKGEKIIPSLYCVPTCFSWLILVLVLIYPINTKIVHYSLGKFNLNYKEIPLYTYQTNLY